MNDGHDGTLQISKNLARRDTQHREAARGQIQVAPRITLWSVAAIMCRAIHLDRQRPVETREVENAFADRVLASEFVTAGTLAKFAPQEDFGEISRAALAFGNFEGDVAGG